MYVLFRRENKQVGCHISVALRTFLCRIFSAVLLKNYPATLLYKSYIKVLLFYQTLQPKYGNLFGRFMFKIVDTCTKLHKALSSVHNRSVASCCKLHCCSSVSTTCDRSVENSIAAALSQQLVTDLLTSRCGPVRTDRYKASERTQISAC